MRLHRESCCDIFGALRLTRSVMALFVFSVICMDSADSAADDFTSPATWDYPTTEQIQSGFDDWVSTLQLDVEQGRRIDEAWQAIDDQSSSLALTEALIHGIQVALPAAADPIAIATRGELLSVPDVDSLQLDSLPPVIRDNLKLLFGKSLALGQLYDESKMMLEKVDVQHVADPAALFFYRAVAHYRLREKEEGIAALDRLLERENELPNRYANLAKLMRIDIESFEPDSLDEIARIMDSIHVRLGHGHAGTRVRKEEQAVIDKLDKMIEELEEQLRQMQAMAQSGSANGLQSNAPAADSMLPGGNSQGDVGRKDLGQKTDWGNLPPKEREKSLQQLGKEFPSHYRDIIEEYFRKLARNEAGDE
jgi:hypothetical protein